MTKKTTEVNQDSTINADATAKKSTHVAIPPPNEQTAEFTIIGTVPYVQLAFSEKAQLTMTENMEEGDAAKKKGKKVRPPRDFDDDFKHALHVSTDGRNGIPAPALRNAMISACKTIGVMMTRAKITLFVEADTFDAFDGTPMVCFADNNPEVGPHQVRHHVRLVNGKADIRVRGMWNAGWKANVRVRYDPEVFTINDVANILNRAGRYVGIGEGRPDSKMSCGMGWGMFCIDDKPQVQSGE